MVFTVGRFGLDLAVGGGTYVEQLKDGAAEVSVSGFVAVADLDAVEVLRQQILGYVSLADELFVPVTWDENPHLDGYYKVRAGDVTTSLGLETAGYATFMVTLERVLSFSAPLMELGVMGAVRASENQVITNRFLDPFFQGAVNPVNYANAKNFTIATVSGSKYAYCQASSSSIATMELLSTSSRTDAAPDEVWWCVVTVRNENASARVFQPAVRFWSGASAYLGATGGGAQTIAAGGSYTWAFSAVAPASTAKVHVTVSRDTGSGAATDDSIHATAVYLSKDQPVIDLTSAGTGVFSGGTSDRSGYDFAWTSTANASTSTATLTFHEDSTFKRCALPISAESLQAIVGDTVTAPYLRDLTPTKKFEAPDDSFVAQFAVAPADFYEGGATLTIGGNVATGRQVVNDQDGWAITNGLIWVRPVVDTDMIVEISDDGVAWTEVAFTGNPGTGVAVTFPHGIQVMRNSPECVTVRLSGYGLLTSGSESQEIPVTVDLSVRRGAKYVSIVMKAAESCYLGAIVDGFSAAVPFNHGWYLASAEVFLSSPQLLNSTPASLYTASAKTEASFGVGFCSTPVAVVPGASVEQHAERQYPWAVTERMRVVA